MSEKIPAQDYPQDHRERHEQIRLSELHSDFKTESGKWAFNRFWDSASQGPIQTKVRAGFDDVSSLDDISYSGKIGLNADGQIPTKYVIFLYGTNKDEDSLKEIAHRFPYAELVTNTAFNGKETERSKVERIQ